MAQTLFALLPKADKRVIVGALPIINGHPRACPAGAPWHKTNILVLDWGTEQSPKLNVPSMDRLIGAGVYYGSAQSEAMTYKGEDVYLVGAANSAGQAAMYFSKYTRSVTMIVRGDSLSNLMSQYLVDQITATPNIRLMLNSGVAEAHGESRLEAITVANSATGQKVTLPASYLFIFIGAQPRTEWVAGVLERDDKGFILTGPDLLEDGKPPRGWPLRRAPYWLEASVPGIFVAGDVRYRSAKRIAGSRAT